eukprot:TRINITY_DN6643_c0_g1_i5.p1 TRINITY_DN6643_c0_g1~~TRINITY_DN6643_c0_g1_i5.p1  ORF type:complete len:420 (-),score=85.26 TRINITY_DN6643_c0_g1_i5:163-1422(-)
MGPVFFFFHEEKVHEHLKSYCKKHSLEGYIKFSTEVKKISRDSDKWTVVTVESDGKQNIYTFDFVVICCGIFSSPWIPENFRVENVIHSSEYSSETKYEGKILVVGNSFSGAEIATKLAEDPDLKIYNSVGKSPYFIPRYNQNSIPIDLAFYRRCYLPNPHQTEDEKKTASVQKHQRLFQLLSKEFPNSVVSEINRIHLITPNREYPPYTVVCDGYYKKINEGKISLLPRAESINGNVVTCVGGETVTVDKVICATGFELDISFFDQQILQILKYKKEDKLQPLILFETVFHPDLENLAFVGVYRGPYFAVMELQARWVCKVFSKELNLSDEEVQKGLIREEEIRNIQLRPQFPHPDFVKMADDLATKLGIHPIHNSEDDDLKHLSLEQSPLVPAQFQLLNGAEKSNAVRVVTEVNCYL